MTLPTKPEVFSREIIKPSSPTPNHKRIHKLSFFDQLSPSIYIPLLFFYNHPNKDLIPSKTQLLKSSLPSALFKYYPLAGKIRDELTIDCNDDGVVFLQARMGSNLTEFIGVSPVDDETLKLCFPDGLCYKDATLSSLLTVQVTEFDCGGVALAICVCHKILDMSSICSFVNYWAALASNSAMGDGDGDGDGDDVPRLVEFNLAELYPPVDLPVTMNVDPVRVKCVSQRVVFDGLGMAKLKGIVGGKVENPTRVEVVLALLHSSVISALRVGLTESERNVFETEVHLAVDLRSRVVPLVPPSSVGNMTSTFKALASNGTVTETTDVVSFAGLIREAKTEYFRACTARSGGEEVRSLAIETTKGFVEGVGGVRYVFGCSSWCGFPYYEADFGWGKPVWVATTSCEMNGLITMLDTRNGDGIEALVCLEEHAMAVFENDEKLLAFCSINPGVIA